MDGHERITTLEALSPHLTPQLVLLALREASLWGGSHGYCAAIAALRPCLPWEVVRELAIEAMSSRSQMEVLAALGAGLPNDMLAKAFSVLQEWDDDIGRIKAQAKLVQSLDRALQDQALTELTVVAAHVPRRVILAVLPDFLPLIVASEGPNGALQIGRAVLDAGKCIP